MTVTAITGATLIDGNGGEPLENATVVIENGKFAHIGKGSEPNVPAEKTVKANGKFIIPGIVNGNVHLLDGIMMMGIGGVEYLARFEGRYHEVIEEAAQIALASGQTTVFDTWNALQPVLLARDRIARGDVPGARIFAAGHIVGMGGPFSGDFNLEARHVISQTFANRMDKMFHVNVGRKLSRLPPNEVRARIRDYLQTGVDMLKFAISDHIVVGPSFHNYPKLGPYMTFSDRVQRLIVEETRAAGLPVITHTTSYESFEAAIDLRVNAMMHCTITAQVPISDSAIEKMKEYRVWGEIQPTTEHFQSHLERHGGGRWEAYAGGVHLDNTRRLIESGAPILMGTDAGCTDPDVLCDETPEALVDRPWTLGTDHFAWIKAMTESGMKPMEILMAVTRNPAEAYEKLESIGTIEVGKLADLIVLGSNPLLNHDAYQDIQMIYKDGNLVDRARLPVEKVVTADRSWLSDKTLLQSSNQK